MAPTTYRGKVCTRVPPPLEVDTCLKLEPNMGSGRKLAAFFTLSMAAYPLAPWPNHGPDNGAGAPLHQGIAFVVVGG